MPLGWFSFRLVFRSTLAYLSRALAGALACAFGPGLEYREAFAECPVHPECAPAWSDQCAGQGSDGRGPTLPSAIMKVMGTAAPGIGTTQNAAPSLRARAITGLGGISDATSSGRSAD
jgi:hypothetical protein